MDEPVSVKTESDYLVDSSTDIHALTAYDNDESGIAFYGFSTGSRNIAADLENIILGEGVPILRKLWQSKYSSYVVYDYEPLCTVGFDKLLLISPNNELFGYLCHIIRKRYEVISKLEAAIANV